VPVSDQAPANFLWNLHFYYSSFQFLRKAPGLPSTNPIVRAWILPCQVHDTKVMIIIHPFALNIDGILKFGLGIDVLFPSNQFLELRIRPMIPEDPAALPLHAPGFHLTGIGADACALPGSGNRTWG